MRYRQSGAIRDYVTSRLGRLRYVTGVTALFALLVLPGYLLCLFHGSYEPAYRTGSALLVYFTGAIAVLSMRRLFDIGWSGWWAVVPTCAYLWLLRVAVHTAHPPILQMYFQTLCTPGLCNAAIFILLALTPGKPVENRFGPPPRPGSMRIKAALAISITLCIGWISIPVTKHYRFQHMLQQSADDALMRALAAEIPFRNYYRSHEPWPKSVGSNFPPPIPQAPGLDKKNLWIWLSQDRSTLVVDAPLLRDGQNTYFSYGPPSGVAVWTTDDGETWHCGLNDVSPLTLTLIVVPESCRDSGTPHYPYQLTE